MEIAQMDLEILAYANKRYNAGLNTSMIVTEREGDQTNTAFVGLNKKQADAVMKSMKTIMRKNGMSGREDPNLLFNNTFEEKVAIKEAEFELATLNIVKQ